MKRLYRSKSNKVFGGIFGGFGDYFDIDPVLLRVIGLFLIFVTGIIPGIVAYILALFIIPHHREQKE